MRRPLAGLALSAPSCFPSCPMTSPGPMKRPVCSRSTARHGETASVRSVIILDAQKE